MALWVGLRVGKVSSVFFQGTAKLSVVFWSFVGGCVRRLTLAGNGFGIGAAEPDGLRSKTFEGEAAS